MYGMDPLHLTAADISKIEEAMNTEDLEHMVSVIDQIVALKLKTAGRKAAKKKEDI